MQSTGFSYGDRAAYWMKRVVTDVVAALGQLEMELHEPFNRFSDAQWESNKLSSLSPAVAQLFLVR